MNFKQKISLVLALILVTNVHYPAPTYNHQTPDQEKAGMFFAGAALSGILSAGLLGYEWYNRLSPYAPFLQIDVRGIAIKEKQIAWHQFLNIQKNITVDGNGARTVMYAIRYSVNDSFRDEITVAAAYLPFSEEQLLSFLAEYRNKNKDLVAPTFPTGSFTKEQLIQLKQNGFCKNKEAVIACYPKWSWRTLSLVSIGLYGSFIGCVCGLLYYAKKDKREHLSYDPPLLRNFVRMPSFPAIKNGAD